MTPDSCNTELSWGFVVKHPPVERTTRIFYMCIFNLMSFQLSKTSVCHSVDRCCGKRIVDSTFFQHRGSDQKVLSFYSVVFLYSKQKQ